MSYGKPRQTAETITLIGRDEMNLVEFPFGPVTSNSSKTFEVDHVVYDKQLKREVNRKLLITGSLAFGLPKPIDDQVLVGMKALTYESGFSNRKIQFSRYRFCKTLGWSTDGRAYRRLEEAFDRIAGTTLKFKDSWWDKGEKEWKSKTFHLIEEVELCSRDRLDRERGKTRSAIHQHCSFVWNETIWKSFHDGNIKKLDMEMFRRIRTGRRKEIPLRLYRILDKRFYNSPVAKFDLRKLCIGTLGLSHSYCPSEMKRVLLRAADWLVECEFMSDCIVRPSKKTGKPEAVFYKRGARKTDAEFVGPKSDSKILKQFALLAETKRNEILANAIGFCKETNPHLVSGYERNQSGNVEARSSYLEMMLEKYAKRRRAGKTK